MDNIELPGGLGQHLGKISPEAPIPVNVPEGSKAAYFAVRKPGERLVLSANVSPSYSQYISAALLWLCAVFNSVLACWLFPHLITLKLAGAISLIFILPAVYILLRSVMFHKATVFITNERCLVFGYKVNRYSCNGVNVGRFSAIFPNLSKVKIVHWKNHPGEKMRLRLGAFEIISQEPIAHEDLSALKETIDQSARKRLEEKDGI